MKNVSTELFRAVVAVHQGSNPTNGSATAAADTKTLEIAFPGRSSRLLTVLSETFAQSENDFASMILSHALSETLKVLPDLLTNDQFAEVENRIISGMGMAAYLQLQPVFPFHKGLTIPNYAEISSRQGVVFGEWQASADEISIVDLYSKDPLFTYQTKSKPDVSFDGITLQWKESNVKPLYAEANAHETFVGALEAADILILGDQGYLYKEDEYTGDLVFAPFSNFKEQSILKDQEFRKYFRVDEKGGTFTIEPLSFALSQAQKNENGDWSCGGVVLRAVSISNVIISPEE